jgi:hypothetical protein
MINERDLLEQALRRFEPEPGLTERIYRRRDRKRRNQRIAAGVVGIAVFVAAVWVVTSGLSFDRSETPAVPGETGPSVTRTPASAAPDEEERATCQFVQPRARAHLELTYVKHGIRARFVLHQMTLPGHRWRIVLSQAHPSGFFPRVDDWRPLFDGTRLATGDSGDITVQRSVGNFAGFDWVRAEARDRLTGQFCRVETSL